MPEELSLDGGRAQAPESLHDTTPRTMFEKIWDSAPGARRRPPTRRRSSTSTCTSSTRSPRRRRSPGCASAGSRCAAPSARWRPWITRRRPRRAAATASSGSSTTQAAAQIAPLEKNCADFGIELHALGSERPGHRPRHRPGAGPDPAGHDHRLRRQPHQHARRVRRAGVRHRHQRGRRTCWRRRACCSSAPKTLAVTVEGQLQPGRHRQGHHPGGDRAHRHRRRHRSGHRVPRLGDPRAVDGRADDRLQHVDRGGRARRHDRARRDDVRST